MWLRLSNKKIKNEVVISRVTTVTMNKKLIPCLSKQIQSITGKYGRLQLNK